METTEFSDIYDLFFYRIEQDDDFWSLYNVDEEEIMSIAKQRARNYLIEAAFLISQNTTTDTNWMDFDEDFDSFNFGLTTTEKQLLASVMFEKHLERDVGRLKVFKLNYTPADLERFSPANERKTFMDMYQDVRNQNRLLMASYSSRDTKNARKYIDHSLYDYVSEYTEE